MSEVGFKRSGEIVVLAVVVGVDVPPACAVELKLPDDAGAGVGVETVVMGAPPAFKLLLEIVVGTVGVIVEVASGVSVGFVVGVLDLSCTEVVCGNVKLGGVTVALAPCGITPFAGLPATEKRLLDGDAVGFVVLLFPEFKSELIALDPAFANPVNASKAGDATPRIVLPAFLMIFPSEKAIFLWSVREFAPATV